VTLDRISAIITKKRGSTGSTGSFGSLKSKLDADKDMDAKTSDKDNNNSNNKKKKKKNTKKKDKKSKKNDKKSKKNFKAPAKNAEKSAKNKINDNNTTDIPTEDNENDEFVPSYKLLVPRKQVQINIWNLSSDFYLHNSNPLETPLTYGTLL